MNGGTCVDEYQSYSCVCDTSMFVGKQCEYLLGSCDFDDPLLPSCKYTFDEFSKFVLFLFFLFKLPCSLAFVNDFSHTLARWLKTPLTTQRVLCSIPGPVK